MVNRPQIRRTVRQPRIDPRRVVWDDGRSPEQGKTMKRLLLVFCLMSLGKVLAVNSKPEPSTDDAQFDKVAARYIDESPSLSPISATTLGDHRYDNQLDEISEDARNRERTFYQRYLTDLARISPKQLSKQRQV